MAKFNEAFEFTIGCEALKNNPGAVTVDEDGRTRYGIAERFHPTLEAETSFYTCDDDDAYRIAEMVYENEYWDGLYGEDIHSQYVANRLLSFSANEGPHQAVHLLQRALGVKEDGVIGPQTLAALNSQDEDELMRKWRDVLVYFYRRIVFVRPSKAKDLNGWLARVAK